MALLLSAQQIIRSAVWHCINTKYVNNMHFGEPTLDRRKATAEPFYSIFRHRNFHQHSCQVGYYGSTCRLSDAVRVEDLGGSVSLSTSAMALIGSARLPKIDYTYDEDRIQYSIRTYSSCGDALWKTSGSHCESIWDGTSCIPYEVCCGVCWWSKWAESFP